MLQSQINNMFRINKELNVPVEIQGGCRPSSMTIDAVKNPAYKSINNSQTIISKVIEVKK